jgi:hypothetical protein
MEKINCPRCRAEIDAEDKFCRCCGLQLKPIEGGEFSQVQVVYGPKPIRQKPSDNPWVVMTMLFLVLGPFALPMLWQGRAFTLRWKWIWTILEIVYTLLLFWVVWVMIKMILEPLMQLRF